MATTTPSPTVVQDRTYTNLEKALYSRGFAADLTRFLGSEEATAAFVAEIFNQARRTPRMHDCTVESIRLNVGKVAALHLNPALPNMVNFIPRKQEGGAKQAETWELTILYGYAALRELITRHPDIVDCFTRDVRANDTYEVPVDLVSPPVHRWPSRFTPRGPVEGYFATVQLRNGHWRTLQMSVAEIQAHVSRYVQNKGAAWERGTRPDNAEGLSSFDKMSLKTVLRMLLNSRDLPMTTELAEVSTALREEEEAQREPTAAERQGYDAQGQRPALTASTGLPMGELTQALYGTDDKLALEREFAHATTSERPSPAARAAVPEGTNGPWRDTVTALIATLTRRGAMTAYPKELASRIQEACARAHDLVATLASDVDGEAMLEHLRTLQDEARTTLARPQPKA